MAETAMTGVSSTRMGTGQIEQWLSERGIVLGDDLVSAVSRRLDSYLESSFSNRSTAWIAPTRLENMIKDVILAMLGQHYASQLVELTAIQHTAKITGCKLVVRVTASERFPLENPPRWIIVVRHERRASPRDGAGWSTESVGSSDPKKLLVAVKERFGQNGQWSASSDLNAVRSAIGRAVDDIAHVAPKTWEPVPPEVFEFLCTQLLWRMRSMYGAQWREVKDDTGKITRYMPGRLEVRIPIRPRPAGEEASEPPREL